MMKRMNLGSRRELEAALRQAGVSLEIYKRGFIEKVLAQQWLKTAVKADEDVPYDELLRYYREHAGEFLDHPPRARWEQLTVQTARFPSREAAYAALAEMGNQVLDGAPLAEVAKARSQGVNAARGGSWDWTSKGALRSKVLDEAIFTLPVGRLSEIIEDDQGFHIVRVIERQPAAMKPFADAQAEIKKTIQSRRQADAKAAFIARLRQQTPVWTAFDNDRSPESTRIDALFR
jgi:parvulin-like peptidyl-prolyl isomerase